VSVGMNNVKKCYICEGAVRNFYKKVNGISILKCHQCKLKWVEDLEKGAIISLYDKRYFDRSHSKIGYRDYLAQEKNHRENSVNILRKVNAVKDLRRSRILEVGCAFGFLLDEARRIKGCDVYGVEINEDAFKYAKSHLGLNVINREFQNCNFEDNFFDVVFLIGTIEHLISPKQTLKDIHRILKAEGVLVITTIDTRGLVPLYSIKPPEHLFYFSHYNICLLLRMNGYKVLVRRPYFVKYQIDDLFHRLSEFSCSSIFGGLDRIISKMFGNISIRIPTNEMLVIAEKNIAS
jgi:SAM-dependent methyltransferase